MSETVIKVKNLGKRYILGKELKPAPSIMGRAKQLVGAPFSWLAQQIKGPNPDQILWALKDISFDVERGEVVGIIGRNGAGKSTLLKILSRITEPTQGYAEIKGLVGSLLEVGTGMHPDLTGRENIYMNATLLGMTRREVDAKFDEIVDFSGIEKFIDTQVKRYSSGMRVRLGFAIAAHLEPEILIVDEVLAVGDIEFQKKCLGKMQDIATRGRTVLFVSHNMDAVQNLCSRAILISNGKKVSEGATDKIVNQYSKEGRSENEIPRGRAIFSEEKNTTKKVWIKCLQTTDADGNVIDNLMSGEDIHFELTLESSIETPCTIALSIRDQRNNLLTNSINTDFGKEITLKSGENRIRLTIRKNNFKSGQYFVNLWIGRLLNAEPFDYVRNALCLDIQNPSRGQFQTAALFLTDTHWESL